MKEYPWGKGTSRQIVDKTANDSDKAFTVPSGKIWDMRSIFSQLSNTATVGTRVLVISITDGTDQIIVPTYVNSAASQYAGNRLYFGAPTAVSTTAYSRYDSIGNNVTAATTMGIGKMILSAGSVIRVYDSAAIDAAADDLYVVLHYVEYDV